MPLKAAGLRIEPPTSAATPMGLHLKATAAPSPPEEPPALKFRMLGLTVVPVMLLLQSRCYKIDGQLRTVGRSPIL